MHSLISGVYGYDVVNFYNTLNNESSEGQNRHKKPALTLMLKRIVNIIVGGKHVKSNQIKSKIPSNSPYYQNCSVILTIFLAFA